MYGLAPPALSNTLSRVFAMLDLSFRRFANRFVPRANPRKLALLAVAGAAAGCGGGGGDEAGERLVQGSGYTFAAPADWTVSRSGREVRAADGVDLLSVTRFRLIRAFRPELWASVVDELDRAAAQLAQQQNGTISSSATVTISGQRARRYEVAYEHEGRKLVERIGFVLRGKTEYLLLCRYEAGGDTDACDRFVTSFRLAAA
jgi:hypothetical protein